MGQLGIGLVVILFAALSSSMALEAESVPPSRTKPPSSFQVYGKDGSEVLSAECAPIAPIDPGLPQKEWESRRNAAIAVSCDFLDLRINGPDLKKTEASRAEMESALKKPDALPTPDKEMLQKIRDKLNDKSIGPKEADFLKRLLVAERSNDQRSIVSLILDMDRRTCGIYAQDFSVDFKKIGETTWVSDGSPQGLCKMVSIYKLERGSFDGDWTLTQTNLAVGGPRGSICDDLRKGLDSTPEVFGGEDSRKNFEFPCDFIDWTGSSSAFLHR